jgi:hypothetical protein
MRLEVFMAVKIHVVVLWVMASCSLLGGYQNFGGSSACFFRVEENQQSEKLHSR